MYAEDLLLVSLFSPLEGSTLLHAEDIFLLNTLVLNILQSPSEVAAEEVEALGRRPGLDRVGYLFLYLSAVLSKAVGRSQEFQQNLDKLLRGTRAQPKVRNRHL